MNPKDGPGLVDVLVTIISPLVMLLMLVAFMGHFLLAPWGGERD